MKKFKTDSSIKGRIFRNGLYSTAILGVVVVLAVLVNLLVNAIPAKYTQFDLSEAGLYTLSDQSMQLAQGLEQDVKIYYLCETGNEDAIITRLLDHYAAESSHITWELKDPAVYPTFAAQYGAQDASSGSLILTCGDNSTVLDAADLYDYDYYNYYTTGSYSVTFGGESQLSGAIYRLTSGEASHAYYTTNHREQEPTSSLLKALNAQNLEVEGLDLLTSEIPEDCDLLIIDDLGTEMTTSFSESVLYNVVNTRLNLGKPMIISTNCTPEDMQGIYHDRLISRLVYDFVTLPFCNRDIRHEKKSRKAKK